jgi:hypothetical protein
MPCTDRQTDVIKETLVLERLQLKTIIVSIIMTSLRSFLPFKKGNHHHWNDWEWFFSHYYSHVMLVLHRHNYSNFKAGVAESWLGHFLGRLLMLRRFSPSMIAILSCLYLKNSFQLQNVISKTQWFKPLHILLGYVSVNIRSKHNISKWNIFVNFLLFLSHVCIISIDFQIANSYPTVDIL